MKQFLTLALLQLLAQFLPAQKFSETLVCENKDIKVVIVCRDTASTSQTNWVKLVIRNKTPHEVTVYDAGFDFVREKQTPSNDAYQRRYKQGRKYDLLDIPYERRGLSEGVSIAPYKELVSSEYLTRNETYSLRSRETGNDICAYFRLKLTFHTNGVSETLESDYAKFCYYWKPDPQIDPVELAKKLKNALTDVQFRQENTVEYLMGKPEVLRQISTEELENALILRTSEVTCTGNALLFKELRTRQVIPNDRLTEFYHKELKNPKSGIHKDLIHYWDNSLFEDLLKSTLNMDQVCAILDVHADSWSSDSTNRKKVYDYLSNKMTFTQELSIQENYAQWSNLVKLMSISRDKKIIDYLVTFLDNEQTFLIEDWSKHSFTSRIPTDPDTIEVRVCDVAFVSLLRATGHTSYRQGYGLTFDENLLEKPDERRSTFGDNRHSFGLTLSEKYIKLSPGSKQKIQNEIAARKN